MNTILFLLFLSIVLAKYKEESIFDWFDKEYESTGRDSDDLAGAIFAFVLFCYLPLLCILY